MNTFKVKTKDVRWLIANAFPTRKRSVNIETSGKVTFHTTNWCEGSLNEYAAVKLSDAGTSLHANFSRIPPWNSTIEGTTFEIPKDYAIVQRSIFRGVDMSLTIYLNPANIAGVMTTSGYVMISDGKGNVN